MKLKCLVTIVNQKGFFILEEIKNKIHTFKNQNTSDILHFVVKDGKHEKISIV